MVLPEAIATAVAVRTYGDTVPNLDELSEVTARINNLGRGWKPPRARGGAS